MAQVYIPEKQGKKDYSSLLPAIGTLAGAAIGGPVLAGGMAGAGLGAGIGGAAGSVGGFFAPNQKQASAGGAPSYNPSVSQSEAMARRAQQQSEDNLQTLLDAEKALPQLPQSLRQEYGPAIIKASYMEQSNRGLV